MWHITLKIHEVWNVMKQTGYFSVYKKTRHIFYEICTRSINNHQNNYRFRRKVSKSTFLNLKVKLFFNVNLHKSVFTFDPTISNRLHIFNTCCHHVSCVYLIDSLTLRCSWKELPRNILVTRVICNFASL